MDITSMKEHLYDVVGALHEVHRELGPGLNECCYQEGLEMELAERHISFLRELTFHPKYHGKEMNSTFRLDFLCKGDIIVECKSVPELTNIHRAQLFNYLFMTKYPCGVLVNFMPSFAVIERYFYDDDSQNLLTVSGTIIQRKR